MVMYPELDATIRRAFADTMATPASLLRTYTSPNGRVVCKVLKDYDVVNMHTYAYDRRGNVEVDTYKHSRRRSVREMENALVERTRRCLGGDMDARWDDESDSDDE